MATGDGRPSALEAIVLAAGSGARFGGGKLMAPFRGHPLIHGALASAFAAPVSAVTVVTGADLRVGDEAAAWASARGAETRLRIVHATRHAEGMAASLSVGIASLSRHATGVFVFLGDMPLIPPAIPWDLAQALGAGASAVAPMLEGRRGHPVLFGRTLFPALRAASGDEGGRRILAALGAGLILVEAPDDGVLFDIDRPDDLRVKPSA